MAFVVVAAERGGEGRTSEKQCQCAEATITIELTSDASEGEDKDTLEKDR